ncbi:MAG: PilW family protein [Sulfuritalea sp.]|nr:PilW family protein [Sulfuritalea sp.]
MRALSLLSSGRVIGAIYARRIAVANFGLSAQRGFTLIEIMVAMAISLVLLSALAALFASTIKTRQQVNLDGQKIDNARFSIETLSEDIRLAGFWGNYTPAGRWISVSWQPISALEQVGGVCSPALLTQGWTNLGSGTVRLPIPILGFEAHNGSGTQTIDSNITACLPSYLAGTDVLMIRRARTTPATDEAIAGTLNVSKTYLQVSACPSEIGSSDFTVAVGSATPALKRLDCSTVAADRAPVWELITRVFYVASENEAGDNTPTLKMIDLSAGAMTPVTISTNVVDLHLEYGIDQSGYQWTPLETVLPGAGRRNLEYLYSTAGGGVTGTSPPVHKTGTASDGAVSWTQYGVVNGSIDDYGRSTINPQRIMPNGSTTGTALTDPWGGAANWQDVMAVKLWVVVRDPESTAGYTNSKEFILGSISVPAATVNARGLNGASFRYKSTGSVVKVVNMSARREDILP